jgi:phosphatidylethanolamine-binding protein (PEBP) family uncharacterized protein
MVDVDAPNGEGADGNVNYLHWLVVNIPGASRSILCAASIYCRAVDALYR